MRRFSQRNSLVTLADINITPLLDLAFVLLIIFVITTPLLEQGLNLNLPKGGIPDRPLEPTDIRTIDVSTNGAYSVSGHVGSLDQISAWLADEKSHNPRLLVYIRADENSPYRHVAAILNRLELIGLDQVSLRTSPPSR